MARKLLARIVVAIALGCGSALAFGSVPILRLATTQNRHVVVWVTVSDLRPVELVAARSPAENPNGGLLSANVRLREAIRLPASAGGVTRWRSVERLPPGTYYVQVLAIDTGGVTDCQPSQRTCGEHWSNVRRVLAR